MPYTQLTEQTRGNIRVAVACSGLGHVSRGIESWAEDLASALRRAGVDVTLFRGAGLCEPWAKRVTCLRRSARITNAVGVLLRHAGGWRYGCGSPSDIEQTTFSLGLYRNVRRGFDVLHVQDYWIGRHLTALYRRGLSQARVVVGNGTAATPEQQRSFRYLQHLTPAQVEEWQQHQVEGQRSFLIPNFISTERFQPSDKQNARKVWGLPSTAFIIVCAAALRRRFKRIDYLIDEFARFEAVYRGPAVLVLAGAHEAESAELISFARTRLGHRVVILENVPRDRMASLYCAADIFTIPALNEVFGIAFIEAMSCGVPIIANDTAAMRWLGGNGGFYADLSRSGGMSDALLEIQRDNRLATLSATARQQVIDTFSEARVIPMLIEMYRSIAAVK